MLRPKRESPLWVRTLMRRFRAPNENRKLITFVTNAGNAGPCGPCLQ